jgi:ankyrin repeat protein
MKNTLLTTIAAVLVVGTAFADPIHTAAENGDLAGVQAELDKGANVNAKNQNGATPLHRAAWFGHKEIVELLIAKGADVNAKDDSQSSHYVGTPLNCAAWEGHKEIAELLIDNGADVNAKSENGVTPLHSAATKEIAELLIAAGADVNAKAQDDYTPLDFSIMNKHTKTADLLRKHGGKTGEELKAEEK